jgi:ABC-type glutathione transport system ATPase component
MSNKPTLLALVGKSGAGKNYIEEYLTEIQTIIPTNKITQ